MNFCTTTSYNTSKYNPLLNIQHDAGRGVASGCGLVLLVQKALKARRLATTEYSCEPCSRAQHDHGHGHGLLPVQQSRGRATWLIKRTPSEASEYISKNRYTWLPLLCLTPPAEGFPWDDLREIFSGYQRMARVPNAVEILPKF